VAKKTADPPKNQPKRKQFYITFSHLADAFIQSQVQGRFEAWPTIDNTIA